jgi:hypothetical protein
MGWLSPTLTLARFEAGTLLRNRRAVAALLLYALFTLAAGAALVWLESILRDPLQVAEMVAKASKGSAEWKGPHSLEEALAMMLGGDKSLAARMVGIPLVIHGFFWVALSFLPFLVALTSHDLLNTDLRAGAHRFVLLRLPRGALLAGRVLAHLALLVGVTVAANAVLLAFAWWKLPSFDLSPAVLTLLRYWVSTVVWGLPWLALAALVSAVVDAPGLSLLALLGAMIALGIGSRYEGLAWITPSTFKTGLWRWSLTDVLASVAAFAAFTAVFLGGAWAVLRGRDL